MIMDDFNENWEFIAQSLREKYGSDIIRILLAGSRAKGMAKAGSDWDVILILHNEKSGKPFPIRMDDKFKSLDGNEVEYYRMNEADFQRFKQAGNELICDADRVGFLL
jgi:predicted nucleotidyltransferase